MIKRGILCVFIALAITVSGFSETIITVDGTAPTFKAADPSVQGLIDTFNDQLNNAFEAILGEINDSINKDIPDGFKNSDNLLTGFGTSSVFSSHGATMRAYADYKFLSISIGTMVGLKLPQGMTNKLTSGNVDLDGLMSEDSVFGFNPQALSLHVGINPSSLLKFLPKRLFFGLRLGYFNLPDLKIPLKDDTTAALNFDTFTIGLTANYQLIPTISLGFIKWRGINIGSGIVFQTTKLDLSVPLGKMEQEISTGGGQLDNLTLVLNPNANLNLNIKTFTIPVEVSTAIKLLVFNIPFGVGFDVGFGGSDLGAGVKSGVNITGANSSLITQEEPGKFEVELGNKGIAPNVFNLKIMTGLGFTFGDLFVIDIPFTYYIQDGFNVGVTLGLRF